MKVWNPDGTLKFDITTRLTRKTGEVQTGNQNGYVDIPNQGNDIFFFIVSNDSSQPTRGVPVIAVNKSQTATTGRISWTFTENIRTPCTIHYGLW
ncbi:TPA: hypothetical protein ACGCGV_000990 [Stenotrophomonas maltophilia]